MKTPRLLTALSLGALLSFRAFAGTLFYAPIPPAQSDANAGFDSALNFTNAVVAGTQKEAGRSINGVAFQTMTAAGNSVTVNNVTLSSASGSLINGGGKSESIKADGVLGDAFTGMIFNDGARDGSEQYIALDPAGLAAGKTYDLRVYVCNSSSQNREVNLSFVGDGAAAVSTDFFNEDDATTSPGGFAEPNQAYYVTYRYKWDGVSTPGVTITQRFGATPFCFYLLTNNEVPGGEAAPRPAGATLVAETVAPVAPIRRPGKNLVVEKDEDDVGVASEVFYEADSLRSHGQWIEVGGRRCWRPLRVEADWSPYTRGRWVHSVDDGWVWDSDEEWGWATYHYGRWFREEDSGWYWVPGRVWAPAWVSWRYGGGYVGWAPLPPIAVAGFGIGIGRWADTRWGIGPGAYNFVGVRNFGAPRLANVIIQRRDNVNIIRNTTNITNVVKNRTNIYNGGPNVTTVNNIINKAGGQAIQTVKVNRNTSLKPVTPGGRLSQLEGGVLSVAAPTVVPAKGKASLPKTDAPAIKTPKIDKGWSGVTDPALKSSLTSKMAGELPGDAAKNAPATLPGTPLVKRGDGSKAAKKAGTSVTVPGAPAAQPGGPAVAGVKKPGLPVKPAGDAVVPPSQPGGPKGTGVTRPGSKVKPTGEPAVPSEPSVKPTARKPLTPDNPSVRPIVKPDQPVQPPTPSGNKPGKRRVPVDEPVQKPAAQPTPKPSRVNPDATEPTPKRRVKPDTAEPTPKPRVKHPADMAPSPVRPTPEPVKRPRPVQPDAPVVRRPVEPVATPPPVRRVQPPPSQPPVARPPKVQPPVPPTDEEKRRKGKPTPPPA